MSKQIENEPAFPIVHPDSKGVQYYGIGKREYIAALIFAGMGDIGGSSETLAKHAVKRADLLLAELAK